MERKRINLSLDPDDYAVFQTIARRRGLTATTLAGALVRQKIDAEKTTRAGVRSAKEEKP